MGVRFVKAYPHILYDVDYFGVCLAKCAIKYKAPDTDGVGGFLCMGGFLWIMPRACSRR